jgi:copper(I)-binding protein
MFTVAVGAVAIAAPLAGCGDDEESTDTTAADSSTTETTAAASADVTVENVWVRPGTTGGNTAIYMDITAGSEAEELTKASVPADVAATVELHETVSAEGGGSSGDMSGDMSDDMSGDTATTTTMDMGDSTTTMAGGGSGMMTMRPVEKVEIPADSTVKLEPGGLHVMLLGLEKDLVVGDTVEVTLTFSGAGEMTLTAEVKEP